MVGFVSERCCCSGRCYSISRLPPAVILTRWGWPSSCSTRYAQYLGYVTRGLGRGAVLLGCFFALLVPFPASVSMNTGMLVWDANLPILWLVSSSFLERADEVLDRVDPMVRCSGDRCFGLISYNLELLSLVGIIRIDIR